MRVSDRVRLGGAAALFALFVVATPAAAAPCGNGNHFGNPNCGGSLASTPELDSALLFGSGVAGVAGYALLRWRSRRRN